MLGTDRAGGVCVSVSGECEVCGAVSVRVCSVGVRERDRLSEGAELWKGDRGGVKNVGPA